ncbi:uncharacterized protein CLUP02_04563 [Colletotrichum lupini]|uniref:Uncharacterized protein n=1 Tax=Colletotrichum lupini TaxID=145971 RepID=A0A9Q8SKJ7_9PEZI|nr:uncharacterized protein CLUP02_04563 [Colletotrichum lupini]UQC79084.1 hypothetical protein CLUP02_04563 [Colletotrichum lupini]
MVPSHPTPQPHPCSPLTIACHTVTALLHPRKLPQRMSSVPMFLSTCLGEQALAPSWVPARLGFALRVGPSEQPIPLVPG